MPVHVIGQHAEQEMSPDTILEPMEDRADLQVDALHHAEGLFDAGQPLVAADDLIGTHGVIRNAGPNDIDSVDRRFQTDTL